MLSELHGKGLTKILKAIGQPGLSGKKKENQITVLLQAIENGASIIKYPEEVCKPKFKCWEKEVTVDLGQFLYSLV